MMKNAMEIKEAQDYLKETYGEEGYQKLMDAVGKKVNSIKQKAPKLPTLIILSGLAKDDSLLAEARLAFLAAIGEENQEIKEVK